MSRFEFKKVTRDDPLINEVYKLRYKVYCDEWGFEKPEDHPGGIEYDEFDKHSVHLVALTNDGRELIGTIRIILNSELGFPIENHCKIDGDLTGLNRHHLGEISRLAVSKEYRRRAGDRLIYDDGESANLEINSIMQERRKNEYAIITGLYTCMYKESLAIGLTKWYAVMAKGLNILLQRMGIVFKPIGPEVDYHGIRTPYIGAIDEIAMKVSRDKAEFFEAYEIGLGG
ncbi:MAG: hypothetical protein FD174_194 [Geobacteraceae bacterium]|nr:MAG: hypothetical protein FD174_194 [Geobacteraceae bacterium]